MRTGKEQLLERCWLNNSQSSHGFGFGRISSFNQPERRDQTDNPTPQYIFVSIITLNKVAYTYNLHNYKGSTTSPLFLYTVNKMVAIGERANFKYFHSSDLCCHLYVMVPKSCIPTTQIQLSLGHLC